VDGGEGEVTTVRGGTGYNLTEGVEMARLKLKEDLRPLSDLETQTAEVVQQAHATGRPVIFTQEGRGVAVLLSVEAFEDLQSSSEQVELQRAVEDAERDIAAGNWIDDSVMQVKLKRWAGIES
jgi:antitoxin YefM